MAIGCDAATGDLLGRGFVPLIIWATRGPLQASEGRFRGQACAPGCATFFGAARHRMRPVECPASDAFLKDAAAKLPLCLQPAELAPRRPPDRRQGGLGRSKRPRQGSRRASGCGRCHASALLRKHVPWPRPEACFRKRKHGTDPDGTDPDGPWGRSQLRHRRRQLRSRIQKRPVSLQNRPVSFTNVCAVVQRAEPPPQSGRALQTTLRRVVSGQEVAKRFVSPDFRIGTPEG